MRASLGVSLGILVVAAAASFACLSPDERDLDEVGGAAGVAGSTAGSAGAGAAAGTAGKGGAGGSSQSGGTTGGGTGGSAGQASGGTGMMSGSGGVAGSNSAGTGGSSAGGGASGGTDPGTGGSENGGSSNAGTGGSSNAGSNNGGSNNAGSGGSNDAGTSGSGTAGSAGTGNCVPNYDCELEPPPSTGDVYQDCVDRINQFRAQCACLPPLERWRDGEGCADQMAEYDSTRSAHAGFADGICEGGSAQNECPGWGSNEQVVDGCLQAMWSEGPPPQEPCEGDCFQEHGHFINMTNERYTAVACGFYETTEGEVWAVQNFTR